ncbi:MAG: hypothetical protein JJE09_12510 [Bacteroidia bacterium]|nr:hypothetical protein [Bacteroidia bacterium]
MQTLNTALEQPVIDIAAVGKIKTPFPTVSIPQGIELDSVFYPSGFVPKSFGAKTGFIIVPLLIYNRFQFNYLTTLGAQQFEQPINEAFKERFRSLLYSCEDSTRILKEHYKLTMDLQSCQAQGIYVSGSWSVFYIYGTVSGRIERGRNATSFVRIRWELSHGNESVASGNVMVTLKDSYLGPVNGFMTANGKRKELSQDDLNFGIPFQTRSGRGPNLNPLHINKMVQVLCLSLDEASETVLKEIADYFNGIEHTTFN